ncbi:hypothetical protein BGW42_003735 [Actinomortierella wolfii]|nr:hypothetical protein BGW42_003735 [Actinomortierella wolfii]
MSVIPAAIMGAKAVSPCVAVGNIFNLKSHPSNPTAAACLLPLVGKDYLSYGNLNALATGKISAETKPRPLSSMEYAEAWLPSSGTPTPTADSTETLTNVSRVPESSTIKELPQIPSPVSPEEKKEPSNPLGMACSTTASTTITTTTSNHTPSPAQPSNNEQQQQPPRLSTSSDQLPIHPLELAPDDSPLLTASFSQYLAGGDFVAEDPIGTLSLPTPQKSHSLPPLPVAKKTQHPLDGQGSFLSSELPPLPTAATTTTPTSTRAAPALSSSSTSGLQLTSVPSLLSVQDQGPGRRHSEPGPTTTSKAGHEHHPSHGNDGQPTRVIRKKTSFASKLRKVFVIKSAQSKECLADDEANSSTKTHQHRGSMSSSCSGDTAVGYTEGSSSSRATAAAAAAGNNTSTTTTTTSLLQAGQGSNPRSREGSASSQSYTPVTSPDLSSTDSPKFHHQQQNSSSMTSPMGASSTESGVDSGGSSEMALEQTPTRTVKKRLSFASISSFFQPKNGSTGSTPSPSSSSSSNNSDDSGGAGGSTTTGTTVTATGSTGRSEEDENKTKKKKQQRSSSVPNSESPLSIVGRQLAGFQRRNSLNDLHSDGKQKEHDDVCKQNMDRQRKDSADATSGAAQETEALTNNGESKEGVAVESKAESNSGAARAGSNPQGTKRTFNVFQASFSSLSRRRQQQQQQQQQRQQQKQKQGRPTPAQPLRSALRRLPPPPALEAASGAQAPMVEGRPRRSASIRSQNSARGGRRHGTVSYPGTQVTHQHPYHPTFQHRHSEPTTVRQSATAAASASSKNHNLTVEDMSAPPRPRLSFIQVDNDDDDAFVYCTSPLPMGEQENGQSGYVFPSTAGPEPQPSSPKLLSTDVMGTSQPSTTPGTPHVHPVQTCPSKWRRSSKPGFFASDEDDDGDDDVHEDEYNGPTSVAGIKAGRRTKKRHHGRRQPGQRHRQSPPRQYHATAQTSDQYKSVLPTNAARISVDRIVMEHDDRGHDFNHHHHHHDDHDDDDDDDEHHGSMHYQHLQQQDIVMTSPTSRVGNGNEYTYDSYAPSYTYDAMQMQSQHLVYQLEQQYGSSSSSSSTSSYPSAAYIDGSLYQHQGYSNQMLPSSSPSATAASTAAVASSRPARQIQFSTDEPMIHLTWTAEQYDRTSDANITALRLTPAIAQKIKLELNLFKSQEMAVHQDSRIYTHFFV